jgi:hypothetical protein
MSGLKASLFQLEARLQSLIEGTTARLFSDRQTPHALTSGLLKAMRAGAQPGPDGQLQAPNVYILLVHSSRVESLRSNRAFLDELGRFLLDAARQEGLYLPCTPVVQVEADLQIAPGKVQIIARDSLQDVSSTSGMAVSQELEGNPVPPGAFLIVDGTKVVPLEGAVMHIGRRPDNQLVIDDPRVSRTHAQLRAIAGHFVLFDLDSMGGTWVNGQRVRQCTLHPGDVISLAGVSLVFGQECPDLGDTQEVIAH